MSDGGIFCGRSFWDGSGGNNHALDHYRESGFPLAVKLGTITPTGGDVYSYKEDDMVLNPKLGEHLAHWGIHVAQMKKTEKSMVEIEIEWNQKVGDWAKITESDKNLQELYGRGYTGMENLGNSCYMNSLMQVWSSHKGEVIEKIHENKYSVQVLFSLEPFVDCYYKRFDEICFPSAGGGMSAALPPDSLNMQMAKLGHGLLSGLYSTAPSALGSQTTTTTPPPPRHGIRPLMFKNIIGHDHRDFQTKQQQDAYEFFMHLLTSIERCWDGSTSNPADWFRVSRYTDNFAFPEFLFINGFPNSSIWRFEYCARKAVRCATHAAPTTPGRSPFRSTRRSITISSTRNSEPAQ